MVVDTSVRPGPDRHTHPVSCHSSPGGCCPVSTRGDWGLPLRGDTGKFTETYHIHRGRNIGPIHPLTTYVHVVTVPLLPPTTTHTSQGGPPGLTTHTQESRGKRKVRLPP